jgi:hypothetical protein
MPPPARGDIAAAMCRQEVELLVKPLLPRAARRSSSSSNRRATGSTSELIQILALWWSSSRSRRRLATHHGGIWRCVEAAHHGDLSGGGRQPVRSGGREEGAVGEGSSSREGRERRR